MAHCFAPEELREFGVDEHGSSQLGFGPVPTFDDSDLLMHIVCGKLSFGSPLVKVICERFAVELTTSVGSQELYLDLILRVYPCFELFICTEGI